MNGDSGIASRAGTSDLLSENQVPVEELMLWSSIEVNGGVRSLDVELGAELGTELVTELVTG